MLGGYRHRFAEAEVVGFHGARITGGALALVGGNDHRLAAFPQRVGDDSISGGQSGAGVDHEEADIGIQNRRACLHGHARGQTLRRTFIEAGRVDQAQIQPLNIVLRRRAVARHTRRVIDNGQALAGEPIEQRRFADIGPADNGDG